MKYLILFSFSLLFVLNGIAQPPAGAAKAGEIYGAPVKAAAVPIDKMVNTLPDSGKVTTSVTAKVLEVCPKKGCWIRLAVDDSTTAFVKMKDYGFFVPVALTGKTIQLVGEAEMKITSVEELRHYAEDAKKTKEEIEAITKPEKEIRFLASGIKVIG